MGGFHIACAFLAVIGKRFAQSGLSDLVVEAGILGPNTVERAMNGKHYNNAVRMFKIVFAAFMRAKIDCFIEWIKASSKDNYLVNFLESENFQNLSNKQDNESLKQCVATIMSIADLMDGYDEMLSDPTENGHSAAFWMSLISMAQIFLNFQKSIKTGNWQLHLQSISSMLPWMHAKLQPSFNLNLCTQQNLEKALPNICKKFLAGNFSLRRKLGSFNKVPSDQVIEQTINKDQKGSGGTVSFSISESTVQRWIVSNHIISRILGDFQQSLDLLGEDNKCKDLLAFRMKFDEDKVKSAYDLLTSRGNPFRPSESLTNLSGVTLSVIECSMICYRQKKLRGISYKSSLLRELNQIKKSFCAPIKQNKLQTFSSLRISKDVKVNEKTVTVKSSYQVFSRFMIQQSRQVSMRDIV